MSDVTFKDLLNKIDNIDRLYSNNAGNTQEKKRELNTAVSLLLEACQPFPEKHKYVQQIIQDIQKSHKLIPLDTPRLISYPTNKDSEKWGKFYDHNRYERLMPYCQLAYLEEKNGIPEEHGLKLAVMFDGVGNALGYIKNNLKQNNLAIHDACLFSLPNPNDCDFSAWKKLIKIQKNINDKSFRDLLAKAPDIERAIHDNKPKQKVKINKTEMLKTLKTKKEIIEELNRELKVLKRKHGSLSPVQEERYHDLIKDISASQIELFEMSAGIQLADSDLAILKSANEYFILKTQGAYKILLENGLTKNDFAKFSALKRQDDDKNIPNVTIHGEDLGYPGVYIKKVDVMDELQAAEAACFGKLTKCCQSLSGEAGEPCVIHGLTSPMGGFYVVKNEQGEVLGQCWAWRSKSGAIVFDSIEVPEKIIGDNQATKSLFNALAKKIVEEKYTHKVACGETSGISGEFGVKSKLFRESFVDYDQYCDSIHQRVIIDTNKPYLLYGTKDYDEVKTINFIDSITKDKNFKENVDFIEMINWSLLENKFKLITEIKEASKKNQTEEKVLKIIDTISDYLNNEEKRLDILAKIDEMPYVANLISNDGNTALIFAINKGHTDVALKLIERGVRLDEKDEYSDKTAVMLAVEQGQTDVALKLIERGAKFDEKGEFGETALMLLIEQGNIDVALKLIERGEKLDEEDEFGRTALMLAIEQGQTNVVLKLIENGAKLKDKYGRTALMYAIISDQTDMALKLIEREAKLDEKDEFGYTALELAIGRGQTDVALKLEEKELKNKIKDLIKEDKSDELVLLIKEKKYPINKLGLVDEDENTCSLLMHACEMGAVKVVKNLLELGVKVNKKDADGDTALAYSVDCEKETKKEIIKLLLNAGADINSKNNENETAIDRAKEFSNDEIVKILKLAPDKVSKIVKKEHADLVLNSEDKDLKIKQIKRATPIAPILFSKSVLENKIKDLIKEDKSDELVLLIKEKKYPINKLGIVDEDENACSLLMHACEMGAVKVVKNLLELGVKVNKKDADGDTALAYSVDCEKETKKEIIKLLLNAGADINSKNNENETAIDRAKEFSNDEIVKILKIVPDKVSKIVKGA